MRTPSDKLKLAQEEVQQAAYSQDLKEVAKRARLDRQAEYRQVYDEVQSGVASTEIATPPTA